jgi:hypothetical protein
MINEDRAALLEEEIYILRDSGEIPEIAYHSTLHYLTEDPEGPRLVLTGEELESLQDAALHRYREIVLRDLDPANRDLGMYRGVRRTLYNWQRMQDFCRRIERDCAGFSRVVARALRDFLARELTDVRSGERHSSVNCSAARILELAREVELSPDSLPEGWQMLCPAGPPDS